MEKYELYRIMLEKDSENAQAWFLLGEECLEQNRFAEGLNAFSKRSMGTVLVLLFTDFRDIGGELNRKNEDVLMPPILDW